VGGSIVSAEASSCRLVEMWLMLSVGAAIESEMDVADSVVASGCEMRRVMLETSRRRRLGTVANSGCASSAVARELSRRRRLDEEELEATETVHSAGSTESAQSDVATAAASCVGDTDEGSVATVVDCWKSAT